MLNYNHYTVYMNILFLFRWAKDIAGSVAIPTHFFKMLVRCNDKTSNIMANIKSCDDLKVMTFIVPHNKVKMCEAQVKYQS